MCNRLHGWGRGEEGASNVMLQMFDQVCRPPAEMRLFCSEGDAEGKSKDEVLVQRTMKAVAARLKTVVNCKNGGDEEEELVSFGSSSLGTALRYKGHAALKKGRLQLAVNFYTQAIVHEEASAAVLSHRAKAYLKLQKYEKAVEDCSEIIELQPKFWKAYALRAEAFRQQRKFAEAMADLRQAKKLHPRRSNMFDKLRLKCRREVDAVQRSLLIAQLTEEARKLPPRPYVRGDKRFTLGQHILRMQECLAVIAKIIHEPGYGAVVWDEEALDRWKKVRIANQFPTKKYEKVVVDYDSLIVVRRLEELRSSLKEVGVEGRQALALAQGFHTLVGVYDYHDELVLEIIAEVCRYGDDSILRAFLHAQPLPILLQGLQGDCQSVKRNSFALLDLAANLKPQKVLTLLIKQNLVHAVLKSMRSGSVAEHESAVSLFFKLVLDPRLRRQLVNLSSHVFIQDLCQGLIRACRADRSATRLYGAQAITVLLEYENRERNEKWAFALVPAESSVENQLPYYYSGVSLVSSFVEGGVLGAVAGLLARESDSLPEKVVDYAPSVWEDDVELICQEIAETVSEFSEFHECTLRNFNLLSGYAQVAMLNAVRAMDYMAEARCAVEVLQQVAAWGSFVSLLSSFPHPLATQTVQALGKLCRRDKRVAVHLANVWPENSSLILMELARSAQGRGDWQTHQAAMLILAELAGYKSFLTTMQDPTSFTILVNLLQVRQSTTAVSAGCTCLAIAITNCQDCMEFAEMHASSLVTSLLSLWCWFRETEQLGFQIEELLYVLMKRSNVLQQAVLIAFKNGKLTDFRTAKTESHKLLTPRPSKILSLTNQKDELPGLSHHEFARTGINFQKVVQFVSTIVGSGKFQPSKFADLCAGAGLLSIQLAKHFREAHCFAVNCKRAWVEHTRRLAKHESLQNLTSVLSKGLHLLPQALPSRVDVAILCLSLEGIHDIGHLFQALNTKLLPQGKLVLIDDNEYLVGKARHYANFEGFYVVDQPKLFERYSIIVLEKSNP